MRHTGRIMNVLPSHLLPDTATLATNGSLSIGGVDLLEIAAEFGTPVFVYDESHLRARCAEAVDAFPGGVAYATKAFLCRAMAELAVESGMKLDVATGGEIHLALAAGARAERLVFHGNNKSSAEIAMAIDVGVGTMVVDSFDEIDRIEAIVRATKERPVRCLLRVTPGIEAHTHEYIRTGHDDSKFGFGFNSGQARAALERVRSSSEITFGGIHAHIGSLIFDVDAFEKEVEILAAFVLESGASELCIGGGLGVPYVAGETAPTISEWGAAVHAAATTAGIPDSVAITAEPGRSIVAGAAVTLYTVGTIKERADVPAYVAVDGGMHDNPRPALYGSDYEAFLPRAPFVHRERRARVVGMNCESSDVLVRDASIPNDTVVGDVLATPVTGAYGYAMASNFNRIPRPPVVFVRDGDVRLVLRRETYDDLLLLETSP